MANSINQAMHGLEKGSPERLRGTVGTLKYQPAAQQADQVSNALGQSLKNFMGVGQAAVGVYMANKTDTAEERSNEIIRKLTPEQRKVALESGTLLYQDDPEAMKLLKYKTGRNTAYEVDSEIQGLIDQGKFKSRKELEEYRQQRFTDASKAAAEASGLDESDQFYQRGFNTDIVPRNAAIYDRHAQVLSKEFQAQAVFQTKADIQPLLDDSSIMNDASVGKYLATHINNSLKSGELPGDRHAITALQQIISDSVQKPGGTNALNQLENQEINVYGGKAKVRDLIGGEVYDNMKLKAQSFAYASNAKSQEVLTTGIATALAQDDPSVGYQQIQELKRQNNMVQPTEMMTPQRQALIAAEADLINKVRQDSTKRTEDLDKAMKVDNRLLVVDQAFNARINGENVATDIKSMPVNPNTGEFKESDLATYAQKIKDRINNMGIPQDQKDALSLKYLRADSANGPFRKGFQTLIDDANQEWKAAIITGNTENLARTEELQRSYAQMPELAMLYPDAAGRFEELNMMANMGIDPKIMIEAEKANLKLTPDQTKERNEVWTNLKNNSKAPELSRIPQSMEGAARKVYDAWTSKTGDVDYAQEQVVKFLQQNTVQFKEEESWRNGRDKVAGMVGKVDLMIDPNNVDSWQQGRDMVDAMRTKIGTDNPWVGTSGLNVSAHNDAVFIQSLDGTIRIRMDKADMAREYQAQQKALEESAVKAAEVKANTRASDVERISRLRGGS
jgi:hypothetical protein